MTRGKFDLTKIICLILLCSGIVLLGVNNSQATPIPLTGVSATHNSETEYLQVGSLNTYYTEYFFDSDQTDYSEAFCVENANISTALYELTDTSSVNSAAVDVALHYWYGSPTYSSRELYQIAIWELAIDGSGGSLNSGLVQYNGSWSSQVQSILDGAGSYSGTGAIALARSPRGVSGVASSQNFLIRASVPDASIMLLLGPALLSLGLLGRRRQKV